MNSSLKKVFVKFVKIIVCRLFFIQFSTVSTLRKYIILSTQAFQSYKNQNFWFT